MGLVRMLKEMRTVGASGELYVVCDSCGNLVEAEKGGVTGVKMLEEVDFKCKGCLEVGDLRNKLEALRSRLADGVEKGVQAVDLGQVDQEQEVDKGTKGVVVGVEKGVQAVDLGQVDQEQEVDKVTKGVVVGDSMVRVLGDMIGRKKRNFARCCLPGARVKHVVEAVKKGVVKGEEKAVVWVGTNDVGRTSNFEFKREVETLLRGIKSQGVEATVLGLLPRYGLDNGRFNQRAKQMNGLLKELCEREEVRFLDVWKVCRREWLGQDSVHLSRIGNREVGKLVLNTLDPKN